MFWTRPRPILCTNMHILRTVLESRTPWWCVYQSASWAYKLYYNIMSITMLKRDLGTGDLCDNIGLVGVSAKWSYVTASPSHHDQAIPILSPLLFMHVGHPYIPLFKIRRIFDLLVSPPFLVSFRQVVIVTHSKLYAHIIMHIIILIHFPFPFSTLISPL